MTIQPYDFPEENEYASDYCYAAHMYHPENAGRPDRLKYLPAANPNERFYAVPQSVLDLLMKEQKSGGIGAAQRVRMLALWLEFQSDDLMGLDGSDGEGRPILFSDSCTKKLLSKRTGFSIETVRTDIRKLVQLDLLLCERRSKYEETGNVFERREAGIGHYALGIRRAEKDLLFVPSNDQPGLSAVQATSATSPSHPSPHEDDLSPNVASVSPSINTDVESDVETEVPATKSGPKKEAGFTIGNSRLDQLRSNAIDGPKHATKVATPGQQKYIADLASTDIGKVLAFWKVEKLDVLTKDQASRVIKTLKGEDEARQREYQDFLTNERQRAEKWEEENLTLRQAQLDAENQAFLREQEKTEAHQFGRKLSDSERKTMAMMRTKCGLKSSDVSVKFFSDLQTMSEFGASQDEMNARLLLAIDEYIQERAERKSA